MVSFAAACSACEKRRRWDLALLLQTALQAAARVPRAQRTPSPMPALFFGFLGRGGKGDVFQDLFVCASCFFLGKRVGEGGEMFFRGCLFVRLVFCGGELFGKGSCFRANLIQTALLGACFSPTTNNFRVSAQIGSPVVRGGPEVKFYEGSTRVPPGSTRVPQGFHEGSPRFCEGCGVPHAVGDIT